MKHCLSYATDEQAEEIRTLRKQLEIPQYDLYLATGVNTGTISRCENFPYRVKKNTADKILDSLHKILKDRKLEEQRLKRLYSST